MNIRILTLLLMLFVVTPYCASGQIGGRGAGFEEEDDDSGEDGITEESGSQQLASLRDYGAERADEKLTTAPGVVVNNVDYIVGNIPITSLDVAAMKEEIKQSRKKTRRRRWRSRRQREEQAAQLEREAVNTLIARAILEREAQAESIIISEARVENEVEKRRGLSGINNEKEFRKEVEKQSGMPFDVWKKNLRFQLIRRQLIQIKLSVPAPSQTEIRDYYRKHRRKLGLELRFREIVLQPRNRKLEEEQRIATLARDIHQELQANPRSFSRVARRLPSNVSRRRFAGGLYDYMPIQEIAERDRLLAGVLYSLRPGQVSQVFRNPRNQYLIVRLEGKRPVPLSKVENGIRQRLYVEKEQEVFDNWIEERKKAVSIRKVQ